jgi:tetratricopeptide (TPR) repeat protein
MTRPKRQRAWLGALVLVALAGVVYAPLRSAGFIWDDDQYVTQNANLRSLAGLLRTWTEPRSIPQYYPLVHTTYWVEMRLFGPAPAAFHATNVALHAAAAILLWRVLLRLAVPGAFFAAALFVVHPVGVESVAWITERKNVLSLALALAALLAYLRFDPLAEAPSPSRRAWWLAFALYVAALLAKSVVCVLPAVWLVLVWWKRGRIARTDVIPLLPFFAIGLTAALGTVWLERHHVGALGSEWSLAPSERIVLAGRALWFYASKLVWPHPLIFFYPRWEIVAGDPAQLVFPVGVVAVGIALWFARGRIGRGPLAAVLLYAGVLFPALGFFDVYPFRYSWVADHFQYHASAAAIAAFAALAVLASQRAGRVASIAAILVVALLAVLAWRQTHVYRDLETLYRQTIALNPSAWNAHLNLANHLSSQGRNAEAVPFARDAVRLAPRVADAHNTLGAVLLLSAAAGGPGTLDESRAAFAAALRIDPAHVDALANAAIAETAAGRHAEAAALYARIVAVDPAATDARVSRARSLAAAGRHDEAAAILRDVVACEPGRRDAAALLDLVGRTAGPDPPQLLP